MSRRKFTYKELNNCKKGGTPYYPPVSIVEVKRSENRQYLVDGAHKLFGYLKDYEEVKKISQIQGVLVGWSNIKEQDYTPDNEIYLTTWVNLGKTILAILNSNKGDS